jgi:hypothetical protein
MEQYPFEEQGGHNRFLSLRERISPPNKLLCTLADGTELAMDLDAVGVSEQPIIPQSKWEPFSLRDKIWWDLDKEDQDGEDFCWGYSATQAHMLARECAGLPRVYLSAAGLCGYLTGGQNRGGGLDEALGGLMAVGQVTTDVVPNSQYNPRGFPKDFETKAKTRRIVQAYDCLSSQVFDKLASGVLSGRPGAFGIRWGRGAHALCAMGLINNGGTWQLEILGSWGSKAHDGDGTLKLAASQMPGLAQFGGYVLGVPSMEIDEILPPSPHK